MRRHTGRWMISATSWMPSRDFARPTQMPADVFLARLGGDFTDAENAFVEELADVWMLAHPEQFVPAPTGAR